MLYKSTCVHQSGPNSAQGSFWPRGRYLARRGYRRSMYRAAAGENRRSSQTFSLYIQLSYIYEPIHCS